MVERGRRKKRREGKEEKEIRREEERKEERREEEGRERERETEEGNPTNQSNCPLWPLSLTAYGTVSVWYYWYYYPVSGGNFGPTAVTSCFPSASLFISQARSFWLQFTLLRLCNDLPPQALQPWFPVNCPGRYVWASRPVTPPGSDGSTEYAASYVQGTQGTYRQVHSPRSIKSQSDISEDHQPNAGIVSSLCLLE